MGISAPQLRVNCRDARAGKGRKMFSRRYKHFGTEFIDVRYRGWKGGMMKIKLSVGQVCSWVQEFTSVHQN